MIEHHSKREQTLSVQTDNPSFVRFYSRSATVEVSTRCGCIPVMTFEIFLLFGKGSVCINNSNRLSHKGALHFNSDNLMTKSQYLIS